jgi:hypothetical protein
MVALHSLSAMAALALSSAPSLALDVGNWSIAYYPKSGTRAGCSMTGSYKNGIVLSLVVNTQYQGGVLLYREAFADVASRMAAEGLSHGMIARVLGVAPPTLCAWVHRRPEFKTAFEAGKAARCKGAGATLPDGIAAPGVRLYAAPSCRRPRR